MQKESRGGGRGEPGVASQGVSGLKETGVRDLGYKTAFLACMAENSDARVSSFPARFLSFFFLRWWSKGRS